MYPKHTALHSILAASSLSTLSTLTALAGTELAVDSSAVELPTDAPVSNATGLLVGKLVGETAMDRAWSAAILYKNDDNQFIQLFQLVGRLQLQSIYGKAGGGYEYDTSDFKAAGNDEIVWGDNIEVRRARLGFKSKFFQTWKVDGSFNVDVDGNDGIGGDTTYYKNLHELFVSYAPTDQFALSIGKKQVRFSRDQEISSTEIVTLERSVATQILTPGELTGVWSIGKGIAGGFHYEVGAYSNSRVREFAQPGDGGFLYIGKIGYEFAEKTGLDSCLTTLTYMHNTEPGYRDGKIDRNFPSASSPTFTDSVALTNDLSHGRFGLITEVMYGFGYTGTANHGVARPAAVAQSDLGALTITPSYFIADGLQLAYRFQVISAADPNGIRVPARYDRLAIGDDESGNTYVSHYLGLNYYIYSHKLKLMAGAEYAQIGGGTYDGLTLVSALRMTF